MQKSAKQLKPLPQFNKKVSTIAQLSKNLFDKIGSIETDGNSINDFPMADVGRQIDSHYDSLTELLSKAQSITNLDQEKILQNKKRSRLILGKEVSNGGTFLTGTGLYQRENFNIPQRVNVRTPDEEMPQGPCPTEMLKDLMKNQQKDDLAELRRMIKETDENIIACHRKVAKTHKNIMNYVEQSYEPTKSKKSQSSRFIKNRFR